LRSWYGKLVSSVLWNGVFSAYFCVNCGVRQGGILSPLLFNVYVDQLIDSLSDSGFGCYIDSQFFGCIMYVDDLIMLSPSLKGLQSMFNLCDAYAKTHFLIFNAKKTFLMPVGRHRFVSGM